jgi:hypothetical protein
MMTEIRQTPLFYNQALLLLGADKEFIFEREWIATPRVLLFAATCEGFIGDVKMTAKPQRNPQRSGKKFMFSYRPLPYYLFPCSKKDPKCRFLACLLRSSARKETSK